MEDAAVFAASFPARTCTSRRRPRRARRASCSPCSRAAQGQAGIVYCGSRAKTERVTERLAEKGLPAVAFHAGLRRGEARRARRASARGEPVSWSPPSPSAWASTGPTCASSCISTCRTARGVLSADRPRRPRRRSRRHAAVVWRRGYCPRPILPRAIVGAGGAAAGHASPAGAMIGLTETTACRTRSLLACFGEISGGPAAIATLAAPPVPLFDGTVAAQKVLSAVYRTGQMFGALHIVSVLRGRSDADGVAPRPRPPADLRRRPDRPPRSGAARSGS